MTITDEQVEAAMRAYANELAYDKGGFRDKMRAALEAASEVAPIINDQLEEQIVRANRAEAALLMIGDGFHSAKDAPVVLDEFVQLARNTLAAAHDLPEFSVLLDDYDAAKDKSNLRIALLGWAGRMVKDKR